MNQRGSLEPFIPDDLSYYRHQVDGIRRMTRMRNVLLADDMGLGKTLQTLTVFAVDLTRGMGEKMLVVCPQTLRMNWQEEIYRFMRRSVHVSVISKDLNRGQRSQRIANFAEMTGPRIMLITYEMLNMHLDDVNKVLFDMLVFDEAHYLKNPKAIRTKTGLAVLAKRSFLLTGSPILNNVHELYTLLVRIGVPYEKIGTYYGFINKYCTFTETRTKDRKNADGKIIKKGRGIKTISGYKNVDELQAILAEYMVRRTKDECLDLPPVQYIERLVELTPEQKKYYRRVKDNRNILTGEPLPEEEIIEPMTKWLRYVQICDTTCTIPGIEEDHSNKLELATADAYELMESGNRVAAFTRFRTTQEAFVNRLKRFRMHRIGDSAANPQPKKLPPIFVLNGDVPSDERTKVVRAWSLSNEPGILVCTFQVAGVGLNMTAGRHVLFLDKLTTPKLNQQAVDRFHRIGASTTQRVQVFEYLTAGTVEKRVNDLVKQKSAVFDNVVEGSVEYQKLIQKAIEEA